MSASAKANLRFLGAANTVTGSRYLIEAADHRVFIDCGLFQGYKQLRERNRARFPVAPGSIHAIVLTHAHLDHSGLVLYKTVEGRRSSLPVKGRLFGYGVDVEVPRARWSTLRVDFSGNLFGVSLNGKHLFDVEDATFSKAGATGLWTKADSVTLFDDFTDGGSQESKP